MSDEFDEEREMKELIEFLKETPELIEILHAGFKIGAVFGFRFRERNDSISELINGLERNHPTPKLESHPQVFRKKI